MIIIFPGKEIADEMLLDLAATPNDSVWVWYDPDRIYQKWNEDTEVYETKQCPNAISYNLADDGRCAIAHPFSPDDIDWLQNYWDDGVGGYESGVLFVDSLPDDWRVHVSE